MSNLENPKYTFYEYLLFFWRKKWIIPILPILLLLIIVPYTMTEKKQYSGQAIVYTGSVDKETWLQPDLIKYELDKKLKETYSYTINKGDKRINFSMSNADQKIIETTLEKITDSYYESISNIYLERLKLKEDDLDNTKKRINELTNSIDRYKTTLESTTIDLATENRYFNLLQESEKAKFDYLSRQSSLEDEIYKFEEPRKLGMTISIGKTNLISNILVSVILGLFLSFVLLTLWKYIEEAKKFRRL